MASSDPDSADVSRVDLESLAADASAARALEGMQEAAAAPRVARSRRST